MKALKTAGKISKKSCFSDSIHHFFKRKARFASFSLPDETKNDVFCSK